MSVHFLHMVFSTATAFTIQLGWPADKASRHSYAVDEGHERTRGSNQGFLVSFFFACNDDTKKARSSSEMDWVFIFVGDALLVSVLLRILVE
jgi:hypothetical protein